MSLRVVSITGWFAVGNANMESGNSLVSSREGSETLSTEAAACGCVGFCLVLAELLVWGEACEGVPRKWWGKHSKDLWGRKELSVSLAMHGLSSFYLFPSVSQCCGKDLPWLLALDAIADCSCGSQGVRALCSTNYLPRWTTMPLNLPSLIKSIIYFLQLN